MRSPIPQNYAGSTSWLLDLGRGPERVDIPRFDDGPSASLAWARTAVGYGRPGLTLLLGTPGTYRHLVADYLRAIYGYAAVPVATPGWFGIEVWGLSGDAVRIGRKSRRGATSGDLRGIVDALRLPCLHDWRQSRVPTSAAGAAPIQTVRAPGAHDPPPLLPPTHAGGIAAWDARPDHVLGRPVLDF